MRLALILAVVAIAGCVDADTAVEYARRAHPECSNHRKVSHRLSDVSLTEVSMMCDGTPKSISVKCVFGFGVLSDTTCHENN